MKNNRIPWALCLILAVSGIAADLTININSFRPHAGQLFKLRVVDKNAKREVASAIIHSFPRSDTTLQFPGILTVGQSYDIDYFADLNNNKKYDAPPTDHAWRNTQGNVAGNLNLTFTHNSSYIDIKFPDVTGVKGSASSTLSYKLEGRILMLQIPRQNMPLSITTYSINGEVAQRHQYSNLPDGRFTYSFQVGVHLARIQLGDTEKIITLAPY